MKTEQEIRARMEDLHRPDAQEWPDGESLLQWVLDPSPVKHVGAEARRCEHTSPGWLNREKIFAEEWDKENRPPHFLNSGIGILEHLCCSRIRPEVKGEFPGSRTEFYRHLTQEEATAAASVIQWLGTNCGWCWMETCIRKCGFDIVQRREK